MTPRGYGGGVGTALFRHAVDRAAALGARRLEWESDAGAVGFYERMGGRRVRDSTTTEVGRVLPIMALDLGQGGEDVSARGRADPR